MGIALEPEMDYEMRPNGQGGCEDPRVTYVHPLDRYLMTYTAFSPVATGSAGNFKGLLTWHAWDSPPSSPTRVSSSMALTTRTRPAFPWRSQPSGQHELAILHRPLFPDTLPKDNKEKDDDRIIDLHRESIWIRTVPCPNR